MILVVTRAPGHASTQRRPPRGRSVLRLPRRLAVTAAVVAVVAACSILRGPYTPHLAADQRAGFVDTPGETLLSALDCGACHEAPDALRQRLAPLPAPDLSAVGARAAPGWLRDRLEAPHVQRADGRMPDLLGPLPEAERVEALDDLLHYLVSLGGPFEATPILDEPWPVARGRTLFRELGCFACHGDELDARPLAERHDRGSLAALLRAPLAAWPSGLMPDMDLSVAEADALAAYLLRERAAAGPSAEVDGPGLLAELFVFDEEIQELPELGDRPHDERSVVPVVELPAGVPADRYVVRLRGQLHVADGGEHTLWTSSDDGSHLFVDGELVVDNDGLHADQRQEGAATLTAGWHDLEITFFENGGDAALSAGWMVDDEPLPFRPDELRTRLVVFAPGDGQPFALDEDRVRRGRARFDALGCVQCHAVPGLEREFRGPDLDDLHYLEEGCLAEVVPPGLPDYRLDSVQKEHLRRALAGAPALVEPLPAAEAVERTLVRMDCLACHARDGRGGPTGVRRAAFASDADLGDEGRLPPDLGGVGARLRLDALEGVLLGDERVRPYMRARMPRYGDAVAHLPASLVAADGGALQDGPEAPFDAELVEAGRELAGRGGLSCISCHTARGQPSLGEPGIDLAVMHRRLQPAWFRRWLSEPIAIREGTRMPTFFDGGRSVNDRILDRDADAQIDALWRYLALGDGMPLPPGIEVDPEAYELVPVDRALVHGCFLADHSARGLAVGFPENVHLAYDREHVRAALVWKGDFLDAEGTWFGRGGGLLRPAGTAVRELPPGDPLAWLASDDEPWPEAAGRAAGWRMAGERRGAQERPVFLATHRPLAPGEDGFSLAPGEDGQAPAGPVDLVTEEHWRPVLEADGPRLVRRFELRAQGGAPLPVHRAALAGSWEADPDEPALWRADDGLAVRVLAGTGRVRPGPDGAELLVSPGPPDPNGWAVLELELSW